MTSQVGTEAHKYTFTELGNNLLLDKIGSIDMDTVVSGIERTGFSWIFDGVAEKGTFNIGGNNPLGDVSVDDYAMYVVFRLISPGGDRDPLWGSGGTRVPFMQWSDIGDINRVEASANNLGGGSVQLTITQPIAGEILCFAMSVDESTNLVSAAVSTIFGQTGSGTVTHSGGGNDPVDSDFFVGEHGGKFGNIEVFEMGMYTTAYSVTDLEDTVAEVITGFVGGGTEAQTLLLLG